MIFKNKKPEVSEKSSCLLFQSHGNENRKDGTKN
jgi:hypothetical protein